MITSHVGGEEGYPFGVAVRAGQGGTGEPQVGR